MKNKYGPKQVPARHKRIMAQQNRHAGKPNRAMRRNQARVMTFLNSLMGAQS